MFFSDRNANFPSKLNQAHAHAQHTASLSVEDELSPNIPGANNT